MRVILCLRVERLELNISLQLIVLLLLLWTLTLTKASCSSRDKSISRNRRRSCYVFQSLPRTNIFDTTGGTLYKASSTSLNSSALRFPGWTPLTSRPKSTNFFWSTLAGRVRGTRLIVIATIRRESSLDFIKDLCVRTPPEDQFDAVASHELRIHRSDNYQQTTNEKHFQAEA